MSGIWSRPRRSVETLSRSLGDGASGCLTTGTGLAGLGGGIGEFTEIEFAGRTGSSGGPSLMTEGLSGVAKGV